MSQDILDTGILWSKDLLPYLLQRARKTILYPLNWKTNERSFFLAKQSISGWKKRLILLEEFQQIFFLLAATVPANKFLFAGRVPANSLFLKKKITIFVSFLQSVYITMKECIFVCFLASVYDKEVQEQILKICIQYSTCRNQLLSLSTHCCFLEIIYEGARRGCGTISHFLTYFSV